MKHSYGVSQAREVQLSFCLFSLFPIPYSLFPIPCFLFPVSSNKLMSVPHQYGNCYSVSQAREVHYLFVFYSLFPQANE